MAQLRRKSQWVRNYLNLVSQGHPQTVACQLLSIGRSRVLQERRRDPEFARELDEAVEIASRRMEKTMDKRVRF